MRLDSVAAAAERGMRVRLLIDDIELASRDALLMDLPGQRKLEVRVFNPFSRGGSRGGQFLSHVGCRSLAIRRDANYAELALEGIPSHPHCLRFPLIVRAGVLSKAAVCLSGPTTMSG